MSLRRSTRLKTIKEESKISSSSDNISKSSSHSTSSPKSNKKTTRRSSRSARSQSIAAVQTPMEQDTIAQAIRERVDK